MHTLLKDTRDFIRQYVTFTSDDASFVAAMWAAGTFIWPVVDTFPYLVITSDTKRSGKTRFAEILSFLCANARNMAGMTPATVFRTIADESPTMFIDEAETLSSESADMMRSILNVGYRRGQTIPRVGMGGKIIQWPVYCPKAFVLIGDVYDTLRDRSIIIRMQRSGVKERFTFERASMAGYALRDRIKETIELHRGRIVAAYQSSDGLPFLTDRDAEIWMPLFAICQALMPDMVEELTRIAVDMSTEKTAGARRYVNLLGAEKEAEDDEYSRRLVDDMIAILHPHEKHVYTNDALPRLQALVTGPWRKFRGDGLTAVDMANMLSRFGLTPKLIRTGGRKQAKVLRGYLRKDLEAVHRIQKQS